MRIGIVTIATGHPYYGRMAYNLCASIKAVENIEFAVIHEGRGLSHLGDHQKNIFDYQIALPGHIKPGYSVKLHLDELSPFDRTIFLDADMLWLPYKKPSELFAELQDADYSGVTEGWYDIDTNDESSLNSGYWFWADRAEILSQYPLVGKFYQWRSEVIYFEKTKRVQEFFSTARRINQTQQLLSLMKFGNDIPDELGINIAANLHHIEPHKAKWTPAYWHKVHGDQPPRKMSDWYLMSFGGNAASGAIKNLYNNISKSALTKLGRQHVFQLHEKASYLPERVKM